MKKITKNDCLRKLDEEIKNIEKIKKHLNEGRVK